MLEHKFISVLCEDLNLIVVGAQSDASSVAVPAVASDARREALQGLHAVELSGQFENEKKKKKKKRRETFSLIEIGKQK